MRNLPNDLPSTGEIFSCSSPPPSHSPQKAPGFSRPSPSRSKISVISWAKSTADSEAAAFLANELDRFVDHLIGDVERGSESDCLCPRFQSEHAVIEQALPEGIAHFRIWQIKSEEQSTTADCTHDWEL